MRNTLRDCLRAVKINKKYRGRTKSVLLVLSVLVSCHVFWMLRQPGVTMAGTATCGIEEHSHTEECYAKTLVCGQTEEAHVHTEACYETVTVTVTEGEPVLICSLTEEPHVHGSECYITEYTEGYDRQVLICTSTEEGHQHTEACYTTEHVDGTETQTLVCDKVSDPHVHSDACYMMPEAETVEEKRLICPLPEGGHVHVDACYSYPLVCTKQEHIHSVDCYSNESANVETQLDWQEMFSGCISGDLRTDLVTVARSQIGYAESEQNYELGSDGVRRGYTRYGAWYGAPYSDWSAMFVSFCLNYAGSDTNSTPFNIGAAAMAQQWTDAGKFASVEVYEPKSGDLIFFADNSVGIISSVNFDVLTVIQGDIENTVTERTIMTYEDCITGYGTLTETVSGSAETSGLLSSGDESGNSSALTLEECNCGSADAAPEDHNESCAYRVQLESLAAEKSAEELCAVWDSFPEAAQLYILQYLADNETLYGTKAADLKELINSGTAEPTPTPAVGLCAECGDVSFTVEGSVPSGASLQVTAQEYTEEEALELIAPKTYQSINWWAIYDISIMDGETAYTPEEDLTVTVQIPDLEFDPEREDFAVEHLDAETGEVLSLEYVTVNDNTVSFTATSFSPYALYSVEFTAAECDCGNTGTDVGSHADICAYKSQLMTVAAEYTAEELYSIWNQFDTDAQDYILQYLTDNAWLYGTKAEELQALIDGGSTGTQESLDASCGTVSFKAEGSFPSTATLTVSQQSFSAEQVLAYFNPNNRSYVSWYSVYDISIMDGESEYTPEAPVTVTVNFPDLVFDSSQYFFCVSHLDSFGGVIGTKYLDMVDGSVSFDVSSFSPFMFYIINAESEAGEKINGTNWMNLGADYFNYWQQFMTDTVTVESSYTNEPATADPSDGQIDKWGGATESDLDDGVKVSKTIDGTDIENVFDITLTVQTNDNISEIYKEPNMAVAIVMDISNTMRDNFGSATRYEAAISAAEGFIDNFAAHTQGVSRIGYVAFNTDAHQIFGLSSCSTTAEATALKNQMRTQTGNIINAVGYKDSHTRFTNIEAGLKMGWDMVKDAPNEYKYVVFLSDGFPTTYISSGYNGYDPYTPSGTPGTAGVFYDGVLDVHCDYGTSYSDTAAKRASDMASTIKSAGGKIFSIGVDVGGQTIQNYINKSIKEWESDGTPVWKNFSLVECGDGTLYEPGNKADPVYNYIFEIGDATSNDSYVNWLQNSIGSNIYYDSTNASDLEAAYEDIFQKILETNEHSSQADWVTEDPLPLAPPEYLEFIGFFTQDDSLVSTDTDNDGEIEITGLANETGENTAVFTYDTESGLHTIGWDLKKSGFSKTVSGDKTTYFYELTYRVRLKNELDGFVENDIYVTNAPTSLTYRVSQSINDIPIISERRTIYFQIPAVHGYLADLSFTKKDSFGDTLAGAEFLLSHDMDSCVKCRGDGANYVSIPDYTATSAEDGTVSFLNIPSGHHYILEETKAPAGYVSDSTKHSVVVAYDEISWEGGWTGEIINKTGREFPSTGGSGTLPYMLTGILLIGIPVVCINIRRRKSERRGDI